MPFFGDSSISRKNCLANSAIAAILKFAANVTRAQAKVQKARLVQTREDTPIAPFIFRLKVQVHNLFF